MHNEDAIDPVELATFISAKLCHDLISPMAAVGNSLEMLNDPTAASMHEDARVLLQDSARAAWSKLSFYRIAFGSGGSAPGLIEVPELRKIVTDMHANAKHRFEWRARTEALEKLPARVLLNLIILAVESLPRGGDLIVEIGERGEHVRVSGTGRTRKIAPHIETGIRGEMPETGFDGFNVQPFYAYLLARRAGGTISLSLEGEGVAYEAALAPADNRAPQAAE